jgi:hypothetical protein
VRVAPPWCAGSAGEAGGPKAQQREKLGEVGQPLAGWVHAAASGLVLAVDKRSAPQVLAGIAAKCIALAAFDREAIAASTARIREVAVSAGIQSPVPHLMRILFEQLTDAIGADAAARLIMSEHLAHEDWSVVRDLVFGIGSNGG